MGDSASFPWLWSYGGDAAQFDPACAASDETARRLNAMRELAPAVVPRFEPSTENLAAVEYERRVSAHAIPTRDLAHDWYNGQVWLAFPEAKQLINKRHVEDAGQAGVIPKSLNGRSRLRDALTLFDESGALLLTNNPSHSTALLDHEWGSLFADSESSWAGQARLLIFGHGLLESMHAPHKGLCAKVVPVHVKQLQLCSKELNAILIQAIEQIADPVNFSPLPVMGIPGWFRQAKAPGFYEDRTVFRAKPTRCVSSVHKRLAFEWDGHTLKSGKCVGQSLPDIQGEESPDSSEHSAG